MRNMPEKLAKVLHNYFYFILWQGKYIAYVFARFPKKNKLNNTYTGHVPLVEQELLTLPEHMNVTPVFSGIQPLVFCAVFNRSS
jgi:hypothetical protein